MNNIFVTGRATTAPELRQTDNGIKVTNIRLAVDRQEGSDFIKFVAWRDLAEFACKHIEKGRKYIIMGHLKSDRDGQISAVADKIEFCERKGSQDNT